MPSAVAEEAATRAGTARKPTTSDAARKRSHLLVGSESSQNVKSSDCSRVAVSKSSSVSSRLSKCAEKSTRQKVDLTTAPAAAVSARPMSRFVAPRDPTVRNTGVKRSESGQSSTCNDSENRNAVKTTRASCATVRLSAAKTADTRRRQTVETGRHADNPASVNKQISVTVTAPATSKLRHEASVSRSGRVPVTSQSRTTSTTTTTTSLALRKPQLKQVSSASLTTSRALLKHNKISSPSAEQSAYKQDKANDHSKSSRTRSSVPLSRTKLSCISAAEDNDETSNEVTVLDSVDVSLPPVSMSGPLCSEPCEETADRLSRVISESPPCESARSSGGHCELVSQFPSIIVPTTCVDEHGSDLEETSVCDISLNSCLSDYSTALFHSACSSIMGSNSDVKLSSLNGSLDTDNVGLLSGSTSVSHSLESLLSSTGYCTPSEHDNLCEVADCTASNTDDLRYVYLLLFIVYHICDCSTSIPNHRQHVTTCHVYTISTIKPSPISTLGLSFGYRVSLCPAESEIRSRVDIGDVSSVK